jgi:protein phosphatase
MMRLELATAEYIGARAQQQDMAAAVPLKSGALLVLGDGLGGHESGADASRIVVETFRQAGLAGHFDRPETRRQALKDTVELANARIGDGVDPAHGHRGMASTAVAAVVSRGEVSWVSVGDSHLYVWRNGQLTKLNEDHSQAGLMIRSGQYSADDPEVRAVKSVLVSALTGRKLEIVDLPAQGFRVEPGDVLILASDGLNSLEDDDIARIVATTNPLGAVKVSTTLLESVRSLRIERQDNATVAVARVLEPQRAVLVEPDLPTVQTAPTKPHENEPRTEIRTERIEPGAVPELDAPKSEPARGTAATDAAAKPVVSGVANSEPEPAADSPPGNVPGTDEGTPDASSSGKPGTGQQASAKPIDVPAAADPDAPAPARIPPSGRPAVPQTVPLFPTVDPSSQPASAPLHTGPVAPAESAGRAPAKPEAEAPSAPKARSPWLPAILILLLVGGLAFASVAILKPSWLAEIPAGPGSTRGTIKPANAPHVETPPQQAAPQDNPAATTKPAATKEAQREPQPTGTTPPTAVNPAAGGTPAAATHAEPRPPASSETNPASGAVGPAPPAQATGTPAERPAPAANSGNPPATPASESSAPEPADPAQRAPTGRQ